MGDITNRTTRRLEPAPPVIRRIPLRPGETVEHRAIKALAAMVQDLPRRRAVYDDLCMMLGIDPQTGASGERAIGAVHAPDGSNFIQPRGSGLAGRKSGYR